MIPTIPDPRSPVSPKPGTRRRRLLTNAGFSFSIWARVMRWLTSGSGPGSLAARLGNREEAQKVSKRPEQEQPTSGVAHPGRAAIADNMGGRARAVALLREAFAQGLPSERVHRDARLEPLWDDPPFQELFRRKG